MNKAIKITIIVILILIVGAVFVNLAGRPAPDGSDCDKEFGLYTANLDGSWMKLLISDSWRQMTHARVSPDRQWVAFTRYNNIGKDGCASENEGNYDEPLEQYKGTEIVLMRIDGSDVRTIIPHEKDKVSANSYWTPDGKGLIYVSAPNEKGNPQINHIVFDNNMEIKSSSKIPIPENVIPTDPHWRGDWIVFPATDPVTRTRGIWRIKYNGEGLEQLTWPKTKVPIGDNDPKFSPDGSKVAFLRQVKEGAFFHAVIVDVNTKEEKDLSAGYLPENAIAAFDGPPEWSSDGELLIFPHILVDKEKALSELHIIKSDGSGRKKVPLPREYLYFHTAFFPDEGSDDNARIIFSAHKLK